jgi:rhomboid family GlyGly-CTERM serine protease
VTSNTSRPGIFRSLNCDGRYGVGLLAAMAVLLAPLAGGMALQQQWRYERAALAAGEWWRFVTAHVVHMDAGHAVLNCVGLALLWALFARSYRPLQWLWVVLAAVVAVDAGLWFLSTGVSWYVGASAALHGVFACGCIALIRQRDRIGIIAGLIFLAKLVWETWQGPLPFESEHPVVTTSHAYGAAGGLLAGLLLRPPRQPVY